MKTITEQSGKHRDLEKKSIQELTSAINAEDQSVAYAIEKELPAINALIEKIVSKLKAGGKMYYIGAGSGGRLSVLDVIELPTTYGIEPGLIDAILAGGKENLVLALEEKEDDTTAGWTTLVQKISQIKILFWVFQPVDLLHLCYLLLSNAEKME